MVSPHLGFQPGDFIVMDIVLAFLEADAACLSIYEVAVIHPKIEQTAKLTEAIFQSVNESGIGDDVTIVITALSSAVGYFAEASGQPAALLLYASKVAETVVGDLSDSQ